jgi:glycosyltransferase involved in cell wall biosynthesis
MRIALLPDEYLPSGTRVHAKMFHELAVSLKNNGHQPIVITPGTPSQKNRLEIDYIDSIEVWRFRAGYTRGVGLFRRAINEWMLPYRAWIAIKPMIQNKNFDLCINYAPTIFFGPLAKRLKKRGAYIYLIVRDMFPQWIIDQGIIRERSIAAYFFKYYEKINYEASDCIGLQSQANLDIFTEKFPFYKNLKILRNWSALSALNNKNYNKEFLNKYNLSDKVILFYGGNTGHAQDMENVMRLAKNMALIDDAHFLIIGQGDEFDLIQSLKTKWRLRNVTILPAVSQVEFRSILAVTDIGLFSLAYNHSAHNFPGKLLGYMVESKPILGSVNPGNDLSSIINNSNAGFVFTNGEDRLLADAAISLVKDKELRHSMGKKSRDLLIREFSVQSAVQNILESVKSNKYQ